MINMAIILGNIGKKQVKTTKNGTAMTILSVATEHKTRYDNSTEYKEETTWHNVYCFGKTAETSNKYLDVGDKVFVRGRMENKKFVNAEGADKYLHYITADEIKFLPRKTGKDKLEKPEKDVNGNMQDDEIPF